MGSEMMSDGERADPESENHDDERYVEKGFPATLC
jgi:hypothetical protein